jgi:hypothetical protein
MEGAQTFRGRDMGAVAALHYLASRCHDKEQGSDSGANQGPCRALCNHPPRLSQLHPLLWLLLCAGTPGQPPDLPAWLLGDQ